MSSLNCKALYKLKMDTRRFLKDHGLTPGFAIIKLFFIVDYWAVFYLRICEFSVEKHGLFRCLLKLVLVFMKPLVEGLTASRLRNGANIGGGLLLHQSMGVVIASAATVGENCTFYSGAVVAHKANGKGKGAASIGKDVQLMTGCKVLGNVVIGDGAIIGANAVVLSDIPAGCVAVGVPARVIINNK